MINLRKSIKQNRYILCILVIILVVGEIKANFDLIQLDNVEQMNEYIDYLLRNRKTTGYSLVITEFWNMLKMIGLLWLGGSSILGVPVVFAVVYMKGYILGFGSGILIKTMGVGGLKLIAKIFLPREIFFVAIILYLALSGIRFSIDILNGQAIRHKNIFKELWIYLTKGLICSVVSLIVILVNINLELHLDKVICLLNF